MGAELFKNCCEGLLRHLNIDRSCEDLQCAVFFAIKALSWHRFHRVDVHQNETTFLCRAEMCKMHIVYENQSCQRKTRGFSHTCTQIYGSASFAL